MENGEPTVYQSENQPPKRNLLANIFRPRTIFFLLIAIVAVEVILGFKTLLTPITGGKIIKPNPLSPGQAILLTKESKYSLGEKVPVTVKVSTGGHTTSGTDLVLRYNPKFLEATPGSFLKGRIYADYPTVTVDSAHGIMRISGVTSPNKPGFNGSGDFGIVNFTAKAKGVVEVVVDYQKDSTSDSNMLQSGTSKDILGKVTNVKITVR